jgi:hypothetical protein
MITKLAAAFLSIMLANSASAQSVQRYDPRRPDPPEQTIRRNAWEAVSPEQMSCLDDSLKRAGQPGVQALIERRLKPSDPPVVSFLIRCNGERQQAVNADKAMQPFVQWIETDLLKRPAVLKAFEQCRSVVAAYQGQLLVGFRARATASNSRSEQQAQLDAITQLSEQQQQTAEVACIKLFIAYVNVSKSGSGSYVDELSVLNGRLGDSFDLLPRVQAKLNDLTDEGMMRLLSLSSFANIPQNELRSEIVSASERPSATGYLACFVTREWVARFSSESFCHGPVLEQSLVRALAPASSSAR